jgi:hypothetical protein
MANTTTIRITHPETAAQMDALTRVGDAKGFMANLRNYLDKVESGNVAGNVSVTAQIGGTAGVQAAATATCAGVLANDTVTIGGLALTAVADNATPTAVQFKIGSGGGAGQNTECGGNLAACINANTTLNKFVVASNAAGVVTVTALSASLLGSKVTFVSSNGTRLAVTGSGYLAGGAGDDVAGVTYSFS